MTAEEIIKVLERAKELGVTSLKVDGLEVNLGPAASPPLQVPNNPIPEEITAKDIVTPMSAFEEMDEELIQYWATPFFDELVAKREAMKHAKDTNR